LEASLGKKFARPHLNHKKLGMMVCACFPSYTGGVNRRIKVQTGPNIKLDHIAKVTKAKRVGGMVQVAEHLPAKGKP
jgi:hypothetical protein